MTPRLERLRPVAPAIAAAVFGIVRLPELSRSTLWYDELFSLGVADLPLAESLRRAIADHTNPPLFYLLLKGWVALGGDGETWVRLLPSIFALLLGAALLWLAREARAGTVASILAIALAAAAPLTVDLAPEVRAYSLLSLLAALSLAAALACRRSGTRDAFVLLTLVNIALVHTHYFGWLTVGAECAAGWWWERDAARRMLKSAALTALAFLPWAAAVLAHAGTHPAPLRNVAWIGAPSLAAPLWLARDLTGRWHSATADLVWLTLLVVALLVFMARRARAADTSPHPDRGVIALLAIAALGVPLVVWGASLALGASAWVERYLVGAAAPTALLAAIAVSSLTPPRFPLGAVAGFAWAVGAFAAVPNRAPTKFDWRRFARRVDVSPGSPRDVYALEAFTAAPLARYAGTGMRVQVLRSLDELPAGDAWLVYRRESFGADGPTDRLRSVGVRVVALMSAEAAGQKIVALRVRR